MYIKSISRINQSINYIKTSLKDIKLKKIVLRQTVPLFLILPYIYKYLKKKNVVAIDVNKKYT